MEALFTTIQNAPLPSILSVAGLLFIFLGLVTKLGGIIEISPEQKRWAIPIGLFILTIGVVLHVYTPAPETVSATPATTTSVISNPESTPPSRTSDSTFQNSCETISISGNILSANCRNRDGEFVYSSLVLRGIDNKNGDLIATDSDQPSTYHQSCDRLSISGNSLSAVCKTASGSLNQTTISLMGIDNVDGVLTYTGNL